MYYQNWPKELQAKHLPLGLQNQTQQSKKQNENIPPPSLNAQRKNKKVSALSRGPYNSKSGTLFWISISGQSRGSLGEQL